MMRAAAAVPAVVIAAALVTIGVIQHRGDLVVFGVITVAAAPATAIGRDGNQRPGRRRDWL